MFEPTFIEPDSDNERTCGTCLERKPLSEFYKDGIGKDGKPRYRRDCKDCYRIARLRSRKLKKK